MTNRTGILRTVALGLLAAGCALPEGASPARPSRPNFLVLVVDDLSESDIDRIPTPHFDALASVGVRFRRAYAAPVCSPARRMLTFGTYWMYDSGSPCTGEYSAGQSPSTRAISLPRLLNEKSYQTALFGKWHLGSYPGVKRGEPWELAAQQHGYDVWRAGMSSNLRDRCTKGEYASWTRVDDGRSQQVTEFNTWAIRDEALEWVGAAQKEPEPWFAMVCFQAPHSPFSLPSGMAELEGTGRKRRTFEWLVTDVDASIGALIDAVDLSNTVVVYLSDNGTPASAKREENKKESRRVKGSTFEGGIRVPMIWAGPGIAQGRESEALISLVDLLPTFSALTGGPGELSVEHLDGISIVPTLRDPKQPAHDHVWAGFNGANAPRGGTFAIITQRWKFMRTGGEVSLFDLEADPGEETDVSQRLELKETRYRLARLLKAEMPPLKTGQRRAGR